MGILKRTSSLLDEIRGVERLSAAELDARHRRSIDEAIRLLAEASFPEGYELTYDLDRHYHINGQISALDGGALAVKGALYSSDTPKRSEAVVHVSFMIGAWTGAALKAEFRRGQLAGTLYHGEGGVRPRNRVAERLGRFRDEMAKPKPDLASLAAPKPSVSTNVSPGALAPYEDGPEY